MNGNNPNPAVPPTTGRSSVETRCIASLFRQSGHDPRSSHGDAKQGDARHRVSSGAYSQKQAMQTKEDRDKTKGTHSVE
jgi:hypothetical protein